MASVMKMRRWYAEGAKNEYGQFMYLETITFVPFDLDGVDVIADDAV